MTKFFKRREFFRKATLGTVGVSLLGRSISSFGMSSPADAAVCFGNDEMNPSDNVAHEKYLPITVGKRVGLIGLDTSHVTAVTASLNTPKPGTDWKGYRVVAAYPTRGSADMEESIGRLAGFTEAVKGMGVEIVDSIEELLSKVDVVMLESVDGRRHLQEALPVLKSGKRTFIDKPIAASLADAMVIFEAGKKYNTPVFTASSLRYIAGAGEISEQKIGRIQGADTYGHCYIEAHHPDLFYYGIHGVEMLHSIMGTGCKRVVRTHLENCDFVTGTWEDNRIGTFRGTRFGSGNMGATVFGDKAIAVLDKSPGYDPLWVKIIDFFESGVAPVSADETLEVLAFMEAADESKRLGGCPVELQVIWDRAKKKARQSLSKI